MHLGFDGGQTQRFIMEIFDQQTGILQANVSSRYPVFSVGGLDPGKLLKINIFAVNTRGKSETVTMEAFTLKAAEKQTGKVYKYIYTHIYLPICNSTLMSCKIFNYYYYQNVH